MVIGLGIGREAASADRLIEGRYFIAFSTQYSRIVLGIYGLMLHHQAEPCEVQLMRCRRTGPRQASWLSSYPCALIPICQGAL